MNLTHRLFFFLAALLVAAAAATGSVLAASTPHSKDLRTARCYGAASRDARHPCVNPRLRLAVVPSPLQALLEPAALCMISRESLGIHPCVFGVGPRESRRRIALVGDSHAGHWRAAVRAVAQEQHWRGTSLTRVSCPFTSADVRVTPVKVAGCHAFHQELPGWFRRHPEVDTVLVSAQAAAVVTPTRGRSAFRTAVAGYLAAWRSLPATVKRIIVLRDVTVRSVPTLTCVENAMEARKPAGPTCAVPRPAALLPDPESVAAHRHGDPRVHVIDLSRFMCSPRLCLPVVGGALVNKDTGHMTSDFALTLAPYLWRALQPLLPPQRR